MSRSIHAAGVPLYPLFEGRSVPMYDQANPKAQRVTVRLNESGPVQAPSYDFSAIARRLWGSR